MFLCQGGAVSKKIPVRILRDSSMREFLDRFPRIPKVRRGRWYCLKCHKEKKRSEFSSYKGGRPNDICRECEGVE